MGGWLPNLGGSSLSDTNKTSNTQTNSSGTQTPIVSDDWTKAFNNASENIGTSGLTPEQQQAVAFARSQMSPNSPVNAATTSQNANLGVVQGGLNHLGNNVYMPMTTTDPRQAANAPTVQAKTAASAMDPYRELFSQELIDPALAAFDYGTDKAFSALDARTAGAGGFANSRSGLGYSDLGAQSSIGRGQIEASAKNLGITGAINAATGDVNRNLSADTTNASNILNNNQFNVNAGYQGDQQKMQAADKTRETLAQITNVSQQVLQNVVTAEGINTEAASALFAAGQISQQQLNQILQLAAVTNGTSFQGTTGSSTHSNEITAKVAAGVNGPT